MPHSFHGRLAKFLAGLAVLSTVVLAQSNSSSRGGAAVCPLSESQTQKSIDAFAKIVPTLTEEPRCVNCHGGVNPFIEGAGKDPSDPDLPPSLTDHGGGKMDRRVAPSDSNPKGSPQSACNGCHNSLATKIVVKDGKLTDAESEWQLAPDFLTFLGKDATTLCKQIKDFSRGCDGGICGPWPDAKKFIAHLVNDEGKDNFTGTAFKGDRGLDREMYPESDIPSEPPKNITAPGLVALGNDWVATTGGEFKGDKDCGCEPAHYAIRVSVNTELNMGPIHHKSVMPPVDVPITFEDDGTYKGEGVANFASAGTVSSSIATCAGQSTDTMKFMASGKAVETAEEQSMHIKLENTSPDVSTSSARCSPFGGFNKQDTRFDKTTLPSDFEGDVAEFLDYDMPKPIPGFNSTMHVEIVKLAELAK